MKQYDKHSVKQTKQNKTKQAETSLFQSSPQTVSVKQ